MATVIIFAISFLALAVLFLSKHREIQTGRKTFVGGILARFDSRSSSFLSALRYRAYRSIQTVKFFFLVHLPEKGRVKIYKTKESFVNGYQKKKDIIMGKEEFSGNGSSSFFLRKMSENKEGKGDKENGERGRIEDSLPE